jgi:hypothetical protein
MLLWPLFSFPMLIFQYFPNTVPRGGTRSRAHRRVLKGPSPRRVSAVEGARVRRVSLSLTLLSMPTWSTWLSTTVVRTVKWLWTSLTPSFLATRHRLAIPQPASPPPWPVVLVTITKPRTRVEGGLGTVPQRHSPDTPRRRTVRRARSPFRLHE